MRGLAALKSEFLSTLIQRNTPADTKPIPTWARKALSRYLSSGVFLSHLLTKNAPPNWKNVPVHVCAGWPAVPGLMFQSLGRGLAYTYTGRFGRGSSGVSCIKANAPPQLSFSEELGASGSQGINKMSPKGVMQYFIPKTCMVV